MVAKQNKTNYDSEEAIVREILNAISSIKYGSIQLIIQDGKLIQIDKTEKLRFPRPAATS